ncbi:MAG: S-methyl-5-thioribose-1-phosphate isomerase [Myxococcales bacterium]|nr:S-methyl-5-thioribose-1-phosphate isomerase [Myxococcales bacterium]
MTRETFKTIEWTKTTVRLLDQRRLPSREAYVSCSTHSEVAQAIEDMVVRGAPAIGIVAAYGLVLGLRELMVKQQTADYNDIDTLFSRLAETRPTAVNLFWALDRLKRLIDLNKQVSLPSLIERVESEAEAIHQEDREMCDAMGRYGADLFDSSVRILTHCNTGALATGGTGTALAVIRELSNRGKLTHVFADETRPFLQGSRLTAWELDRDQIPVSVITDSMAADLMKRRQVDAVIVGADRITANGDVANKIGTYGLAVLCRMHEIPFYVVAPTSTVDLGTSDGSFIEIEQRSSREVTHVGQYMLVPDGVAVLNPAFDVTPNELITAIITEYGVVGKPYETGLLAQLK